jgi:hypothetical protein
MADETTDRPVPPPPSQIAANPPPPPTAPVNETVDSGKG